MCRPIRWTEFFFGVSIEFWFWPIGHMFDAAIDLLVLAQVLFNIIGYAAALSFISSFNSTQYFNIHHDFVLIQFIYRLVVYKYSNGKYAAFEIAPFFLLIVHFLHSFACFRIVLQSNMVRCCICFDWLNPSICIKRIRI